MSEKLRELRILLIMIGVFAVAYFLPIESERFLSGIMESLYMLREYAQLHVLLCLIPALFIAGAVGVFVSQAAVMKYLGASAKKWVAYSVASVSGAILAVCSCTILPLFGGIYKRGAGLGPATTFLYSGPAINILAIVMTARILGWQIGLARALGAVAFSIVIGMLMQVIFAKEERERSIKDMVLISGESKPLWQTGIYFALMILILVIVNWAKPPTGSTNIILHNIYASNWLVTGILGIGLGIVLWKFFGLKLWMLLVTIAVSTIVHLLYPTFPTLSFVSAVALLSLFLSMSGGEAKDWVENTWSFAKQIIPLLFIGVMIAGALLGRPGSEAWIPSKLISALVGGNSLWANFFASIAGAFMYFATLTEVPILQGLLGSGMGKGPALALLLSGPALSLPSMLVINQVLGIKKTAVYVALVVLMSTLGGFIFGMIG